MSNSSSDISRVAFVDSVVSLLTTSDRDKSSIEAVVCDSLMAGSFRNAGPAALGLLDQRLEILLIRLAGRFANVSIASGTLSASGRVVVCAGINPERAPESASACAVSVLSPTGAASASVVLLTDVATAV